MFVVVPDEVYADRVASGQAIKSIGITANVAAGERGDAGHGGAGGRHGRGAHLGGSNLSDGPSGRDGADGNAGAGPAIGGGVDWVTIDVMAANAYGQFIAQQLAAIGGP